MRVGDLVMSSMWFAHRKKWDEKRIGLIIGKFDPAGDVGALHNGRKFQIMWNDTNRLNWYGDVALNNEGSVWTRVIDENSN